MRSRRILIVVLGAVLVAIVLWAGSRPADVGLRPTTTFVVAKVNIAIQTNQDFHLNLSRPGDAAPRNRGEHARRPR